MPSRQTNTVRKILKELNEVMIYYGERTGVPPEDAAIINSDATAIAQLSTQLAISAREVQGDSNPTASVLFDVQDALG